MTVCLLLAAGSSSRMNNHGRHRRSDRDAEIKIPGLTSGADPETDPGAIPKMLLSFKGKSLLQHTIDEIKQLAGCGLVTVTGCYHSVLKNILGEQQIDFTENTNWEQGMGSSIQQGMKYIIENYKQAIDVIILVCDQPHISSSLLNEMISKKQQTGKGIIACTYDNTTGTPVLFDKKYFPALSTVEGKYGAKKIVQQFINDTATVNFLLGSVDIDTPGDYAALIKK